jgi:RimJ/RimL family protein N-acetyltransferase
VSWGDTLAPTLRGRIVAVEPLRAEHEELLWPAASDPAVWRFMTTDASTRDVFHRWFEAALAARDAGTEAPFAVLRADTGEGIGSTRYLSLRPEHRVLEIGYTWCGRAAWGAGINVETKYLLLEHAFERLGAHRVEFKTEATNERSRAALAALPAEFEGVFRKHMLVRGGERRDSAWYAVIDDEWPEVKENLARRLAERLRD